MKVEVEVLLPDAGGVSVADEEGEEVSSVCSDRLERSVTGGSAGPADADSAAGAGLLNLFNSFCACSTTCPKSLRATSIAV